MGSFCAVYMCRKLLTSRLKRVTYACHGRSGCMSGRPWGDSDEPCLSGSVAQKICHLSIHRPICTKPTGDATGHKHITCNQPFECNVLYGTAPNKFIRPPVRKHTSVSVSWQDFNIFNTNIVSAHPSFWHSSGWLLTIALQNWFLSWHGHSFESKSPQMFNEIEAGARCQL